jgi:pantoate ligase / CMP/dCMP kinase
VRLLTTVAGLRCELERYRRSNLPIGPTIGLVPTMGALHAGHRSLIERARRENDSVVVTIFVNPLQFGPQEDLAQYPRTLEADRAICQAAGVDILFAPSAAELGIDPTPPLTQVVPPAHLQTPLCGRTRPGHFIGVATIVARLFNLVAPDRAYFGQKDAQQLAIIRRLVQDLSFPVEVVACPIVRSASGLALSSRNQYLSAAELELAPSLYRGLSQAVKLFKAGERKADRLIASVVAELNSVPSTPNSPMIQTEYLDLVHPITLAPLDQVTDEGLLALAARLGQTRLIDNQLLRTRKPIVAIDGPAGAGKSTVTRQFAKALGLVYLDTGAMYRAITWLVMDQGLGIANETGIAELVSQCQIELLDDRVSINGQDVTDVIRSPEVTAQVSAVSAQAAVRQALVQQQRDYGQRGGVVLEGRDIGTHVFPDAELKIFLTATTQERARRRQADFQRRGQSAPSLAELVLSIADRDAQDSSRAISPLRQAVDAVEVVTDGMSIDQVVDKLVQLYADRVTHG